LITRLPVLGHGYGEDPDAWRAMIAARHLLATGEYVPSRPPGYPLPEYIDAAMLSAGLGSSLWIGLLTAIVSAAAAALICVLFMPLGVERALIGVLAVAFTPEVFVASTTAMDYVWGLTFFVAATLCVTGDRVWLAAVFLGLAVASRPTYVLAVIPVVLLYVGFDWRRLGKAETWRRIGPPLVVAVVIALAFFMPAILTLRGGMLGVVGVGSDGWILRVLYQGSVGLFGVVGFLAVACAVVSAVSRHRHGPRTGVVGMDAWAFTVIAVWGVLFVLLPQDAAYLFPALPGLYWLLCRYANRMLLWVMVAALAVSCLVLRVEATTRSVSLAGPALWNVQAQSERDCVAGVVGEALSRTPNRYVVAGFLRPQLLLELGEPLSDRVLYTVRPDDAGRLQDTEQAAFPAGAELWVLDRVEQQQAAVWPGELRVMPTYDQCPTRS
jgi:hypothetical protein